MVHNSVFHLIGFPSRRNFIFRLLHVSTAAHGPFFLGGGGGGTEPNIKNQFRRPLTHTHSSIPVWTPDTTEKSFSPVFREMLRSTQFPRGCSIRLEHLCTDDISGGQFIRRLDIIIYAGLLTTIVLRPFSGTTRVSRCQKRTSGLYGARED